MIDFRSGHEPKSSSFDYISIRIASPEEIRQAYHRMAKLYHPDRIA